MKRYFQRVFPQLLLSFFFGGGGGGRILCLQHTKLPSLANHPVFLSFFGTGKKPSGDDCQLSVAHWNAISCKKLESHEIAKQLLIAAIFHASLEFFFDGKQWRFAWLVLVLLQARTSGENSTVSLRAT